jgi:rhodanese-related sulfurtransferase
VAEDPFGDVTPAQLKQWFAERRALTLIDVRDPEEWALVHLPGAELLPVGQIAEWSQRLDPQQELVLYCHHGIRSLHAAMFLAAHGFNRVMHLRGGLDAYSQQVDPNIPRY